MNRDSAFDLIAAAERAADPTNPDRAAETAALAERFDELEALLDAAIPSDPATALRIAAVLPGPAAIADRPEVALGAVRRALEAAPSEATPARARAQGALASLLNDMGDLDGADQAAMAAVTLAVATGDPRAAAQAETTRAGIAFQRGDLDAVEAASARAVEHGARDEASLGHAFHLWVLAAKVRGDLGAMRERAARSIDWGQRHADRRLVATEHANLGDLLLELHHDREAAQEYAEALEGFRRLERWSEMPGLLPAVALLAVRAGDPIACATLLGAVDAMPPDPGAGQPGDPRLGWQPELDLAREHQPEAFDAAVRAGRAASIAQATSFAIDVARRLGRAR